MVLLCAEVCRSIPRLKLVPFVFMVLNEIMFPEAVEISLIP